jgi:hypothetical protein
MFLTDKCDEFYNIKTSALINKLGIVHYSTNSVNKSAHCERLIQTLRRMLGRILTHKPNANFKQIWPSIIKNYNASWHSTIKTAQMPSKTTKWKHSTTNIQDCLAKNPASLNSKWETIAALASSV